jgi:hypothetical protein
LWNPAAKVEQESLANAITNTTGDGFEMEIKQNVEMTDPFAPVTMMIG